MQMRNHKHPHLLLEGTEAALRLFGLARTPRNVMLTGRGVAAAYAALAVVALPWLVIAMLDFSVSWSAAHAWDCVHRSS